MKRIRKSEKPIIVVKSYASCANLGPGFDILGLALNIFNTYFIYTNSGGRYHLEYKGEINDTIPLDENNLIIRIIRKVIRKNKIDKNLTRAEIPLKIDIENKIPIQKGLGSSAAAIAAGLLIANKFYGLKLSKEELLEIGVEIEGHPDNIAPSLFGGLVICYKDNNFKFKKIKIKNDYKILLMIPEYNIKTKEARKLIPHKIPVKDCIKNLTNFYLLIDSLKNGNLSETLLFVKDYLHQPYRAKLYPRSIELLNDLIQKLKIPSVISGAGPSVIGVLDEDLYNLYKKHKRYLDNKYEDFKQIISSINFNGCEVV